MSPVTIVRTCFDKNTVWVHHNQGGRTSSAKHVKKLHSILRYTESLWGFTEIKQVRARSIQLCWGSMGFNAWSTFVLRVEHPYIVRKLEKSLEYG